MPGDNNNRPIIEPLPAAAAAADVKKLTMKGLKLELNDLTDFIEGDVLNILTDLQTDVDALKEAQTTLAGNQTILQEGMFVLSGDVMKANPPTTEQEPEPEPKALQIPEPVDAPTPPPEPLHFGAHQHTVLETIADSCIGMNDILLLCKAMKKVPELTDQTRMSLLDLAGRRAGIEIQPGMQARAGVKMIAA